MLTITLHAQQEVTKFLGIPVDGSKASMIQKLEGKGFEYAKELDLLVGEFNGTEVLVSVRTHNNRVRRIAIVDNNTYSAAQIKVRYEKLCRQFANNGKYKVFSIDELPDSKDLWREMAINKKQYEASFLQEPFDIGMYDREVWFMIGEYRGEYVIVMYYDNTLNEANGEDL